LSLKCEIACPEMSNLGQAGWLQFNCFRWQVERLRRAIVDNFP
jgi:hypothetical protein